MRDQSRQTRYNIVYIVANSDRFKILIAKVAYFQQINEA